MKKKEIAAMEAAYDEHGVAPIVYEIDKLRIQLAALVEAGLARQAVRSYYQTHGHLSGHADAEREADELLDAALAGAKKASQQVATDTARLDWIEEQFGLHKELDITYVVDGYEVEFTHDGNPTDGKQYHGETLRDALDKAMASQSKGG